MQKKGYSKHKKQIIKQRDGNKCFFNELGMCESGEELTVAHIFIWKKDYGKPVEENGIAICRDCHDKLDFGLGITKEEQIKRLRLCEMYLTLYYFREITNEELTFGHQKRKVR
jgi:hypothetical protein